MVRWEAQEEKDIYIHWKDWCWSWSSSTLATWCKEPTHWGKTLMLGKIEGRRRERQRMRQLDSITTSMDMGWANSGRQWRTEEPGVQESMGLQSQKTLWLNSNNRGCILHAQEALLFPYMIHGEDFSTSLLHRPDLLSQKQKSNLGKTSNLLFY